MIGNLKEVLFEDGCVIPIGIACGRSYLEIVRETGIAKDTITKIKDGDR